MQGKKPLAGLVPASQSMEHREAAGLRNSLDASILPFVSTRQNTGDERTLRNDRRLKPF